CSDLNREPRHYECHALTIELQAQHNRPRRIIVLGSFRTSTFSRRRRMCSLGKAIREICSQLKERNLGAVEPSKGIGEIHLYLSLAQSVSVTDSVADCDAVAVPVCDGLSKRTPGLKTPTRTLF